MKFKPNILLLLGLITSFTFAQNPELKEYEYNNSTAGKISFVNPETCQQIEKWIKADIKNNNVYLFLSGGYSPVIHKTDKEFENKYGIYFFDFGCITPSLKCVIEYNTLAFDYLSKKFDTKWIREIRNDVIGLKEWKKKSGKK